MRGLRLAECRGRLIGVEERAGDGIRTHDVQLGKLQGITSNPLSDQGVTSSPSSGCTTGCTSEPGNANAGTVEALAAALLGLSPAGRARLAAMLVANAAPADDGKRQ
jgi:hypothetical protein